jgi:formate hydrogenlyase subunit 3/multisubunit Na+/H+ antiporter MnhD subunit
MAQPQPARPATHPWTLSRVLMLIAFTCFLIAALIAAKILSFGTWLPWVLGGFASVALSWTVPW